MKTKKTTAIKALVLLALSLTLTLVFTALSLTGCSGSGGGGKSLNSATELMEYLNKQPANSPDQPIKVAMKANEMMIKDIAKVISEAGKYVSLNLSGSPLTAIPQGAFENCKTLAGITIPDSVTGIGGSAFYGCTSLTSIIIPKSVTSIEGRYAFGDNLTSITVASGNPNFTVEGGILYSKTEIVYVPKGISGNVTIPNGVTSIREYAFANTGLTSVTIPNSVTSIEDGAFYVCTGLTSVTIPNSVTSIGRGAFMNCASLKSVTIPTSVTSIGNNAFVNCAFLTSVTFQGTIDQLGDLDGFSSSPFDGDLDYKYYAGGIGTYTTTTPVGDNSIWTKQ